MIDLTYVLMDKFCPCFICYHKSLFYLIQIQEELERNENSRTDLQETIKQLQERRNSQGRNKVPMVLNPHGIEPTFLKLDSWSPGAGFIPFITSIVLNQIKKEKNKIYAYKRHLTQQLKKGSILCWVQFHTYLEIDHIFVLSCQRNYLLL